MLYCENIVQIESDVTHNQNIDETVNTAVVFRSALQSQTEATISQDL